MDQRFYCHDEPVQMRAAGAGRPPQIIGYAARFYNPDDPGTEFQIGPNMVERLNPRVFDGALERGDDVVALFNHDPNYPLGRRSSGTMRLEVDDYGLRYIIDPPNTSQGRDLSESIQRGDIQGSSFAFAQDKPEDSRYYREGPLRVVELLTLRLLDVSPVTFPAYAATTTGMRERFQRRWADAHRLIELEHRRSERLARFARGDDE